MDNVIIKIGGREIPLRFRMNQYIEIEEQIGNLGEIRELIISGKKRLRNLVNMIRILGNAGIKHAGEQEELTNEWLLENMKPYNAKEYTEKVMECLLAETESQAAKEENENKERDLVLEEIERKKEPVNTHTGG